MKYQVCRPLTPIEYEALRNDIAENGVLVPIEIDENGDVLDGHHRIQAWQELKAEGKELPDYPRIIRAGLTEEQKRNHARKLNVLRRHMGKDEREQMMVDMRKDGMSYRKIGEAVGMSDVGVMKAIKSGANLLAPDEMPRFVTGADGKQYPAKQERKPLPPNAVTLTLTPPPASDIVRSEMRFVPAKPFSETEYEEMAEGLAEDEDGYDWQGDDSFDREWDKRPIQVSDAYGYSTVVAADEIAVGEDEILQRAAEIESTKPGLKLAAANHAISDDPDYDGDEWYTPPEIIEAARVVMGSIDLDPATCEEAQQVVKAEQYYTKADNSLRDEVCWYGNVWLNPPYSMPLIAQFVDKLISEYESGNTNQAIIITNNSSETDWFQTLLERYPACFRRRRVRFWRPNVKTFDTRQGQALFYLGDNVDKFCTEFSKVGVVVSKL